MVAPHVAAQEVPEARPSVQQEEVARTGAPAARVVPSVLQQAVRPSVVRVALPSVELSELPSDLQEPVLLLARR